MLAIELLILMVPVVLCVRVCVCVCVCVYVCAQLARNLFVFFAASSSSCAPFVAVILSVVHFRSLSLVDCNLRIILLLHAYFYIYIYIRAHAAQHTHIFGSVMGLFVCVPIHMKRLALPSPNSLAHHTLSSSPDDFDGVKRDYMHVCLLFSSM